MIYKLVTRVIQYFCFPNRPMKVGGILDFWKGGNLRKGGGGGGGMIPLTNYDGNNQYKEKEHNQHISQIHC